MTTTSTFESGFNIEANWLEHEPILLFGESNGRAAIGIGFVNHVTNSSVEILL
jgi:hypothetical protein